MIIPKEEKAIKVKMIAIPQDINDIGNLTDFSDAISTINKFNANLTKFGEKILYDKFVKNIYDWNTILTEEDKKKNEEIFKRERHYEDDMYLFDYVKKILIPFDVGVRGWIMGDITNKELTVTFSDNGEVLIARLNWETQSARFSHVPWIPQSDTFKINLRTNQIIK